MRLALRRKRVTTIATATRSITLALCTTLLFANTTLASELFVGAGFGPQPGSDEHNKSALVDFTFYDHIRSERQMLSLGSSLTYISNDLNDDKLTAFSLYPELKLFTHLYGYKSYFHVRALGPTWLTSKQIGSREQAMHFALQAQVGVGVYLDDAQHYQLRLFYRHFSNANLKQPNDGIDVPFNLALGIKL
ncbi:acyloxyacyl hydrolase [Thaumasiovibrio sp. DFM-14]|uniref:acyloxyacyl hydrolase n=1 Tax=Thaumasiovibrio sp. DFM-14 TaxID=3384792 RepID=UPI00399F9162